MRRRLSVTAALSMVSVVTVFAIQDLGTVKVTAPRTANVRAEPNDKAPIVSTVTAGTILTLKAIEGDWFKVQLPPMGAIRVEAYISKKVAQIETLVGGGVGAGGKPSATTPAVENKTGISVIWQVTSGSTTLAPREARVSQLTTRADSVRAMASALPPELHAPIATGDTQVAYVWTLEAAATGQAIDEKRPAFIIQFKDVPGVSPDELTPALVRLAAAPSGLRVVALARGRADEVVRTTPEWDVMSSLRQDTVRADVKVLERGTARIQSVDDLTAGEYAIVIRPPRKRLAGATVLSDAGEGRLLATVWMFTVK